MTSANYTQHFDIYQHTGFVITFDEGLAAGRQGPNTLHAPLHHMIQWSDAYFVGFIFAVSGDVIVVVLHF